MFNWQDPVSKIYQVKVKLPDGRYKQSSAGTRNEGEANKFMRKAQDLADATAGARRMGRKAFLALADQLYYELFGEPSPLVIAVDYARRWLKDTNAFVAEKTARCRRTVVNHWADYLIARKQEGILLPDVAKPLAQGFANHLVSGGGCTAASANAAMEIMVTMFNAALKAKLTEENPFRGMRVTDRKALADQAERTECHMPYTHWHIHRMIEMGIRPGVNPEMTIAVLLSLDFGARGGDMFAILRQCFDPRTRRLRFYVRKLKHYHSVFLYPPTAALLREYLDHHLSDGGPLASLFPTFATPYGPAEPDDAFSDASTDVCGYVHDYLVALAIRPSAKPSAERGRAVYTHGFHSGRSLCITMHRAAGHSQEMVMERVDQLDEDVNDGYTKFGDLGVCRAMYEKAGFKDEIPAEAQVLTHITFAEAMEEIEFATKRLISLRGQLDLCDGVPGWGVRRWRAKLIPVSEWRNRKVPKTEAAETEVANAETAASPAAAAPAAAAAPCTTETAAEVDVPTPSPAQPGQPAPSPIVVLIPMQKAAGSNAARIARLQKAYADLQASRKAAA
jgi:hypothetical protein